MRQRPGTRWPDADQQRIDVSYAVKSGLHPMKASGRCVGCCGSVYRTHRVFFETVLKERAGRDMLKTLCIHARCVRAGMHTHVEMCVRMRVCV